MAFATFCPKCDFAGRNGWFVISDLTDDSSCDHPDCELYDPEFEYREEAALQKALEEGWVVVADEWTDEEGYVFTLYGQGKKIDKKA